MSIRVGGVIVALGLGYGFIGWFVLITAICGFFFRVCFSWVGVTYVQRFR